MPYTPAMDSVSVWEGLFMLVVLKIPLVYLCGVVWWAIRAEPLPEDGPGGRLCLRPVDAVRLGRPAAPALAPILGPAATPSVSAGSPVRACRLRGGCVVSAVPAQAGGHDRGVPVRVLARPVADRARAQPRPPRSRRDPGGARRGAHDGVAPRSRRRLGRRRHALVLPRDDRGDRDGQPALLTVRLLQPDTWPRQSSRRA